VRIRYSGICGAQINEIDAVKGPDRFLPHLLGHEGVGEVIGAGPLVKSVSPGDTVILHWMAGEGMQADPASYRRGQETINAGWVTTLSEVSIVSENRVTRIDSTINPQVAPLLGCAATTAWGCLVNDAKFRLGESVVVLGAGGVGLLTIDAARAGGATAIVAVDKVQTRVDAALRMGADTSFSSAGPDLESRLLEALGPMGAEVVIETTGAKEMIELAYRLASSGGRAVLVGVPRHNEPAHLDTLPLHFGMHLTGSKGGSIDPAVDIPRLADMATKGLLNLESIPISLFPLSSVNDGIQALRDGLPGRVVIDMAA